MKNFDFLESHRGLLAISVVLRHSSVAAYQFIMEAQLFGVTG
jgi:hypothetical protein